MGGDGGLVSFVQWLAAVRDFVSRVQAAWGIAGQPDLDLASWYRSAADNQAAGGLPDSLHLWGLAIDVTGEPDAVARFERAAGRAGMGILREIDHLHVQLWPRGTGPRPPV